MSVTCNDRKHLEKEIHKRKKSGGLRFFHAMEMNQRLAEKKERKRKNVYTKNKKVEREQRIDNSYHSKSQKKSKARKKKK